MRVDCLPLIEKEHCYLVEGFTKKPVIAGFTKHSLAGNLPDDIYKALSFIDLPLDVAYLNQIHSSGVEQIDSPGIYEGDGLFTFRKNLVLVVKTADCLPLLGLDEKGGLISAIHMGWRSAESGILHNMPVLSDSFKLIAACGLRRCCYRVGEEFRGYARVKPYLFQDDQGIKFDPIAFIRKEMRGIGVTDHNFFDLDVCNHCSTYGLPSYRRDKTLNRTLSFIVKI
ncbi:MAG: polyphenol oxidase family protein [Candidatus Omnitrophica bacterium]|nr:polyphenol oxidase family protein [Candidatus Omnitrophota bacterium]